MKTGNTGVAPHTHVYDEWPQWSPVMKTGNTSKTRSNNKSYRPASMEPGHEDREYRDSFMTRSDKRKASMEPGHEDREYRLACFGAVGYQCCTLLRGLPLGTPSRWEGAPAG